MALSLSYCAQEVRRSDHDRFLICLFAPAERREALFALLAFNLELARTRELVREPMMGRIRLQWWRETIEALYQGQAVAPGHHVVQALAPAILSHRLSRQFFDRVIDAREADLEETGPATLEALLDYAEATSAPLIALVLEVLGLVEWDGAGQAAALEAGRRVGLAWALTGLMRAVPFHRLQRRVLLPADLLARHGLSRTRLLDWQPDPKALAALLAELAGVARQQLVAARELGCDVPMAALPPLLLAPLAEHYLKVLARHGHNPFAGAVQTNFPLAALLMAWRAWRRCW